MFLRSLLAIFDKNSQKIKTDTMKGQLSVRLVTSFRLRFSGERGRDFMLSLMLSLFSFYVVVEI